MVSKWCYKEASTPFEVLEQFYQNQFSNLDPRIVAVFLKYISYMLIGKTVRLSTQESGQVVYVSPTNYAHPIVRVDDRIVVTDDNCKCIALED